MLWRCDSITMSNSVVTTAYIVEVFIFFFKQKTAYEMRISDWSSDVSSSDLRPVGGHRHAGVHAGHRRQPVRPQPAGDLPRRQQRQRRGDRAADRWRTDRKSVV